MGRESNKSRRAANEQTARERAAAMRLEQQRKERRRRMLTIVAASVGVLAVVGVIIGIAVSGGKAKNVGNKAVIAKQLSTVSDASLNSAGTSGLNAQYAGPGIPSKINDSPLTSNGKPELLYIGAEFCPYCAGERWALAVALSKFGKLDGFDLSHSGTTDGDLSTLTFRKATYSSPDLTFTPIEAQDRNHNNIKNPTAAQTALWEKYTGKPPNGPGYPFLDFGGKYVATDPTFDPFSVLGKLTAAQIAKDIKTDPNGAVAKPILTNANYITAAICGMTGDKPSACTASIKAIEQKLPARQTSSTPSGSTASPAAS